MSGTEDVVTFDELWSRATEQRESLLFRLLPRSLYEWLTGDEIVDMQSIRTARQDALDEIVAVENEAWITLWKLSSTTERTRDKNEPFDPSIRADTAQVEDIRSRLGSLYDATPAALLTAREHARLRRTHRELGSTAAALREAIERREAAAGEIRDVLAEAHCSLLQARTAISQLLSERRAFDPTICDTRQMVAASRARISELFEVHNVATLRPTEVTRVAHLRSQLDDTAGSIDALHTERDQSQQWRARARNDVIQWYWETEPRNASGEGPGIRLEAISAGIDALTGGAQRLRDATTGTVISAVTPVEYAREYDTFKRVVDRVDDLRKRRTFERRLRRVQHRFAKVVRRAEPYLNHGEYWSESARQDVWRRLDHINGELRAIRTLGAILRLEAPFIAARLSSVWEHAEKVRSHPRLDVEWFRTVRTEGAETVYRRLADVETAYWDRRPRIRSLCAPEAWSDTQREQLAPAHIDVLREELECIERTRQTVKPEGVRHAEYGQLYGYRSAIESDLTHLQRRLCVERILHKISEVVTEVETDTERYLNYRDRCPESELSRIQRQLDGATVELQRLRRVVPLHDIPERVRRRIETATEAVTEYRHHFREYNRAYVERPFVFGLAA
jgi:hypothetical protein